ncbi:MAG: hypothetical protein ACK5NT_10615 [Pyrinomonadaceae bacterium]
MRAYKYPLTVFTPPLIRNDLDRVFSVQIERTVNRDNTVKFKKMILQIEKQSWRGSLEGSKVIVYEHLNETISIGYGHHEVGRFTSDGETIKEVGKGQKKLAATGK